MGVKGALGFSRAKFPIEWPVVAVLEAVSKAKMEGKRHVTLHHVRGFNCG
jgi:hypothetical protein